jgi:nicotinamide-nucleotide amidase
MKYAPAALGKPTASRTRSANEDHMAQQVDTLQKRVKSVLDDRKITVGVAESLTGGELCARLAATPGSSDWFLGGLVAYARSVKYDVLGVPPGPVISEAAAATMASGACRVLGTDLGIAVTGVAGPDEQDGQPPGTVWIGLHHGGVTTTRLVRLSGSPEEIIDATCARALNLLIDHFEDPTDDN